MKVGIDTIELDRLKNICNNEDKLKKVFTKNEIDYFNKFTEKISHISGFFCAKEAFVKALGIGFCSGIAPLNIEVLHDSNGKPYINVLSQKIKELILNKNIEISISHSKTIATAICIIS